MDNLADLYEITNTGMFRGRHDPSFSINLILGGENPLREDSREMRLKTLDLISSAHKVINYDFSSDWLECSEIYKIYENDQTALYKYRGFYDYSLQHGFNWRWRQINNSETRYLHWLLLGPFAPYSFPSTEAGKAA